MKTAPLLPTPEAAHAGRSNKEVTGAASLIAKALLWKPKGGYKEATASTVARYAMHIIELATGKAFSAEECRPMPGTPVLGVAATATINPAGADNSILYTAVSAGTAGNSTTIAYVISGGGSAVLSVAVSGQAITVTAGSATTAASVITAVNANAYAAALVTASASGTVTGAIAAVTATNLTGGIDATEAKAGQQLYDSNYLYTALADVAVSSTTGWKKSSLASL